MDLSRPRLIDFYTQLGNILHNRLLLSEPNTDTNDNHDPSDYDTNGHTSSTGCEDSGHTEDHDIEEAFQHIYFVMLFMACLWFTGKVFARCGLPSLVGEIVCGIILGPNLLGFVPYSDSLIVIGEIGLVLLVLEAGIDVSIGHLKVVGFRGLVVAVFGSMVPLGIGTGLATAYGQDFTAAIAIGACLAPTSMGIALNVLRNAKVLNTPTGQLIIAAAVLDDVIALMLLSELEAMANPTPMKIILPLIVSPAFILFFGFLAIKVTPWVIQKIMIKTSKHQHENVILLLLFTCTFALVPICFYAGSSHLLGAFLAGLMFCTDHTIHEAWSNQIKRIMQWMLRIFFACTIGFAVPIQDFWSKPVIIGAFLYFVAIIGKLLTGFFAKPLTVSEFFTIAFSMSAWGEFAFILATASYGTGSIDKDSYSSVLMAVLMSVVISPLLLRFTLSIVRKQKHKRLTGAREAHYDAYADLHDLDDIGDDVNIHPVYFCVHTKGRGRWGHQDKLLHCIFALDLEIIDFRAFNEAEYNYSHHLPIVQDVFYVIDKKLALPPTKRLGKIDERKLQQRYKQIKRKLKETMGDPHASIDVMRWLPGVRRTDDIQTPVKGQRNNTVAGTQEKKKRKKKTASYCRKEAYRQARLALDHVDQQRSSSYLVSGISRIRPSHDADHRNKFSYHGSIHTEQDDLIAMAFIDTLQSLQASLSPENRASPTGSTQKEPLSHDELFAKINTLRNCVEHLSVFQPALSDDGNTKLSNPPSIHSIHETSFDAHYAQTFLPLQHPNISAGSIDGTIDEMKQQGEIEGEDKKENNHNNTFKPMIRAHTDINEHGSILGIEHNKPSMKSKTMAMIDSKPNVYNMNVNGKKKRLTAPPQPGLFISQSHPHLPSVNTSNYHGKNHSHFNHLPRDIFPRDSYTGYGQHGHGQHGHGHGHGYHIPSQTHSISSDHNGHHALHPSSTEDSMSEKSDDHDKIPIMYGDEDEQHRPLNLYPNLDDLDEEPLGINDNQDDDERSEERSLHAHTMTMTMDNNNNDSSKNNDKGVLKRSTTWSKLNISIFKHKHEEKDNNDKNNKKKKRRKRKNGKDKGKNKKKDKNKDKDKDKDINNKELKKLKELSSSSIGQISWEDDDNDSTPVDPKMLQIPKVLIDKTHTKVFGNDENDKNKLSDDMTDGNGIDNENEDENDNETKPLKS